MSLKIGFLLVLKDVIGTKLKFLFLTQRISGLSSGFRDDAGASNCDILNVELKNFQSLEGKYLN